MSRQEDISLFESVPQTEQPDTNREDLLGPHGKRARLVRIASAVRTLNVEGQVNRVRLNFFPPGEPSVVAGGVDRGSEPVDLLAILDHTERDNYGIVTFGALEADEHSWLSIVTGTVFGLSLNSHQFGMYEVVLFDEAKQIYVARELDEATLPEECGVSDEDTDSDDLDEDPSDADTSLNSDSSEPHVVDLMIVYTKDVRQKLKTDEAVLTRARNSVAVGNKVLKNSGLSVRLNLMHVALLPNYEEPGGTKPYYTMLAQLVEGSAPGLEGLHSLRKTHKADLVAMLVADNSLGGLAKRMGKPRVSFAPYGYSVVYYAVAASTWTLVHEIGHNFGCCHEKACYTKPPHGRLYGRGHTFVINNKKMKTVMVRKSEPGERVPYFSNPLVNYRNTTTATGEKDRDNARVIRDNAPFVVKFMK